MRKKAIFQNLFCIMERLTCDCVFHLKNGHYLIFSHFERTIVCLKLDGEPFKRAAKGK